MSRSISEIQSGNKNVEPGAVEVVLVFVRLGAVVIPGRAAPVRSEL